MEEHFLCILGFPLPRPWLKINNATLRPSDFWPVSPEITYRVVLYGPPIVFYFDGRRKLYSDTSSNFRSGASWSFDATFARHTVGLLAMQRWPRRSCNAALMFPVEQPSVLDQPNLRPMIVRTDRTSHPNTEQNVCMK